MSSIIPNSILIRQPIVDGFNKHAHTNHAREPLREIQSLHNKKNQNSISVPSCFNKRSLSCGFVRIPRRSLLSPQQEEFFFISKKYFQRLKTMDSILWVSLGHIKPFLGIFCNFFHIYPQVQKNLYPDFLCFIVFQSINRDKWHKFFLCH